MDGELFIGGNFQTNLGQSINFLARKPTPITTVDFSPVETPHIYPNPFTTSISLESIENGANYSILSIDGRLFKNGQVVNKKIDNLDFLPNGVYLLQLESRNGSFVKKIIK